MAAVLTGEKAPILSWINGNGLVPEARLQVYRNIVFNNLMAALRSAFPVVEKLTGDDFFEGVAARYISCEPSRSGNLQDFGYRFPQFLASLAQVADVPYLPEIARLEWMRQEAYLAADAEAIDLAALAGLDEEGIKTVRLQMHPSLRLLSSDFPVMDVWMFCQEKSSGRLQLTGEGQSLAVWRSGENISMQELDTARYQWVALLNGRSTLGASTDNVTERHPEFDLAGSLHWLFHSGLVSGVIPA